MLENLRAPIILYSLAFYPIFCFLIRKSIGSVPDYVFGFIFIALTLDLIVSKISRKEPLKVPFYLRFFGFFVLFTIFAGIFVSDLLIQRGFIKYLYTDNFIRNYLAFLLIENTVFPSPLLRRGLYISLCFLILGAIVSVIQVSNPFFYLDPTVLFDEAIASGKVSKDDVGSLGGAAKRILLQGYRFSIYSWVNSLSVGFDSMAIFSILFGIKGLGIAKKSISFGSSALIAFLSNSRWIMLNFIVVSFQTVILQKNIVSSFIKYVFLLLSFVLITIIIAPLIGIDLESFVEGRLQSDSASTRFFSLMVFTKIFPSNPIFGTGGVTTSEVLELIAGITSQIHVGWLKLFYFYGFLGGGIYLIFFVSLLYQLRLQAYKTKYWGGYFAFFAFGVANATLVCFHLFWHGLLLALIFSKYLVNETESVVSPPEAKKPYLATS